MNRQRSRGMALLFSLVILIVLTVLGAAVMSGSGLELRMSSNALDKSFSFNNAEDVRGSAENAVDSIVEQMEDNNRTFTQAVTFLGLGNGFYDLSNGGTVSTNVIEFWQDATKYKAVGANGAGYAVEYLGVYPVYLNRLTAAAGGSEELMHFFRMTVVGRGSSGALTAVQAVYMRN